MTLAPHVPRTIRVASVPSSHVYVRHLAVDIGEDVVRLPDLDTGREAPVGAPWWPPRMLEADWVDAHHDEFDVHHVHFGFDARTPEQLDDLVRALRRHGKPLVLTVHDLRNPHHAGSEEHDAQLDVLVPAADALVTLTEGAAALIRDRWDREAAVVPHPHVVDEETMREAHRRRHEQWRDEVRVGLHCKSLRASMDPVAILPALAQAVDSLPGGVLQVDVHTDVARPDGARHDAALMGLLDELGADVRVHDYFTDSELWAYLADLDVSVLPYRFGTHSGWLEACRDLGTAVVAPTCGFYADQAPVHSYVLDEDDFDPRSLRLAVLEAVEDPAPFPTVADRQRQRHAIAVAHHELYSRLLGP